jgi:YVTN family beta-propeller protein
MKKQLALTAILATTGAFLSSAPAGHAADDGAAPAPPPPLATGLVSPLHISDGPGGSVLVSEEFAGRLVQIARTGERSVVYEDAAWDVAGSDRRDTTIYLAESQGAGPDERPLAAHIRSIAEDGTHHTFGDLAALENTENADGGVTYGFQDLPAECAAQLPPDVRASYTGDVDSHPYGIDVYGNTIYVADAGANSVVAVDAGTGAMETIAVLPSRPFEVTAEVAAGLGLPACVVGHSYEFEPVPTDVKRGPDGWLYVSSLPGGPEDPALGARGAVFKVDPDSGRVRLFADEVMSPTGLDMDTRGNVYVASLFGEGVLRLSADSGRQRTVLPGVLTADVDLRGETLYATVNTLSDPPDGQVVSAPLP